MIKSGDHFKGSILYKALELYTNLVSPWAGYATAFHNVTLVLRVTKGLVSGGARIVSYKMIYRVICVSLINEAHSVRGKEYSARNYVDNNCRHLNLQ